MILADKKNDSQLLALVPSIKRHMDEWQIVNVNVMKETSLSQQQIIEKLMSNYEGHEGLIYPVSTTKIVMLVRLGIVHNYAYMKTEIEQRMPKHCCRIMMRKVNAAGLKQIQIDLMEREDGLAISDNMYQRRQDRKENVILIADDDRFTRLSMAKLLAISGSLVEAENASEVMSQYLNRNPDIVFLDIHMPGKSGLEVIKDIIGVDPDAYIIVLSADSSAGNVLKALEEGAAGFLSKPPSKAKVQEYINQCITVK